MPSCAGFCLDTLFLFVINVDVGVSTEFVIERGHVAAL